MGFTVLQTRRASDAGWIEKGAQCSDVSGVRQEKINSIRDPMRPLLPRCGYPQKLWITVWMTEVRRLHKGFKNVTHSNWSFFSHPILSCGINGLHARFQTLGVNRSSRLGRLENSSRVCITSSRDTAQRPAVSEKFVRQFTNLRVLSHLLVKSNRAVRASHGS